ncbi:acyl-CoA dehydrogenase family protein [Oceaniserpentilla sp. 4NH20-0058]|uniref:acyl-CoA dehydrogenase family protein n=1 Tax=Oceaniserpentilla sp. 4NH20-0058 TaxID=3127660 RepID=UPI00310AF0BE
MEASEQLALLATSLNRFLDQHVAPFYEQWEKDGIIPKSLWRALGDAGYLCVDMHESYGAGGGSFRLSAKIIDVISQRGYAALAINLSVHSDIVAPYIAHLGTQAQKNKWLPKLITGEVIGAIAMTEPNAGSDIQSIQTNAKAIENGFSISGQKTFITNGQNAGVCIVAAKTQPTGGSKGMSLFLLDAQSTGYEIGRNLEKIGLHSGDTSELFFQDVKVEKPLGDVDQGFKHLMEELPRERLILAVGALGACRNIMDMTIEYTQQRQAFGQPIAHLQNTRFKLAELETQIKVNQAFVDQCINEYEAGQLEAITASQAKLSTTELQCKVADECLQLFGGYGYMQEYPISRAYLDARIQKIYGGTSEIMKEIIARGIFK